MAPSPTVSFDEIIQAGRQKKKNERLAQEIFGKKDRRASTPTGPRASFKAAGSLASRISKPGQPARAASSSSLNRAVQKSHNGQFVSSTTDLFEHLASTRPNTRNNQELGSGLSIRGIAGPAVVVGRNFAPGTTAADIESAMESVGGEMQACNIISSNPTVTAEMVFPDKANADAVIASFNNQKADGRILSLFLKRGPPTVVPRVPSPRPPPARSNPPSYVESSYAQQTDFYSPEKQGRHAEPEIQDGSFGFNNTQAADKMTMDVDPETPAPAPAAIPPPAPEARLHEEPREEIRMDRSGQNYGYDRRDDRRENGGQYSHFNNRPNTREYRRPPQQQRDFRGYDNRGGRDGRGLYSDGLYSRPRGRGDYR